MERRLRSETSGNQMAEKELCSSLCLKQRGVIASLFCVDENGFINPPSISLVSAERLFIQEGA